MENKISKQEITGFRIPTSTEVSIIQNDLLKDLRRNRKIMIISQFFFICLTISSIYEAYSQAKIGLLDGTFAVNIVLGLFCIMLQVLTIKQKRHNKLFFEAIKDKKFEVIDCTAYDAELIQDMSHACASVFINVSEKFVKDEFVLRLKTPSEWKDVKNMSLILMKCDTGLNYEYRLYRK